MVERLVKRCGQNAVMDCVTCCNSTHQMAQQMLEMKDDVNAVFSESGIDTRLVSEWTRLEEMTNLLAPFSSHTDILQSNSLSLSLVLPSLMDLKCHLQQLANSTSSEPLSMLADLTSCFLSLLCHQSSNFNPLPAAACLLDQTVTSVLLTLLCHQSSNFNLLPTAACLLDHTVTSVLLTLLCCQSSNFNLLPALAACLTTLSHPCC